jgi:hypothetical protein
MGSASTTGLGDEAFMTRAADNEVYLVVSWRKHSKIFSPAGKLLAQAEEGARLTIAEFDPFTGREFGDATGGTFPDHRARLFRERVPAAYAILTDPEPPILARFADQPLPSPQQAARLSAEVLTTGEERFAAAEQLMADGAREKAIAEFKAMSEHFGTTWIGKASRKRLNEMAEEDA